MLIPTESKKQAPHASADGFIEQQNESIDFRIIFWRIGRGFSQILGLTILGLVVACTTYLVASRFSSSSTSTRVVFSFPGAGKGLYPDNSKFTAGDLAAPDVIAEALKQVQLNTSGDFQSKIRAGLNIEGIIPTEVVKSRDKMITAGQTPPPYSPDEYIVTLTLAHSFPLTDQQRERLLDGIVSAYREKFQRTYASVPLAFGNLKETLSHVDFDDYERILSVEMQSIDAYLKALTTEAPSFRSSTTNLSFDDLLKESELFSQVYLDETLSLIRLSSLSHDRKTALLKMDYELQTLADQEHQAVEEEKTTRELLNQAESHAGNYILGTKSQAGQATAGAPLLDQGLIDSLLANDTYSFMMRKALDASLKVKDIQSTEARIAERRKRMEIAMNTNDGSDETLLSKTLISMNKLDSAYQRLIADIRNTYADYSKQQFADAIRLSAGITTDGLLRPLVKAGLIGLFLGGAFGIGLSLLEVYIGGRGKTVAASE